MVTGLTTDLPRNVINLGPADLAQSRGLQGFITIQWWHVSTLVPKNKIYTCLHKTKWCRAKNCDIECERGKYGYKLHYFNRPATQNGIGITISIGFRNAIEESRMICWPAEKPHYNLSWSNEIKTGSSYNDENLHSLINQSNHSTVSRAYFNLQQVGD